MEKNILSRITEVKDKINFSGTLLVKNENEILIEKSYGYANRSEQIQNKTDTRFAFNRQ